MNNKSNICPGCGNVIQPWAHGVCYVCARIEKEYRRYGRRRPGKPVVPPPEKKTARKQRHKKRAAKNALQRRPSRRRAAKPQPKPMRKLPVLPLFYEVEYGLKVGDQKLQRKGINRFLRAVYRERRYLSQILGRRGFKREQIARLREEYLERFLQRLVAAWRWWLSQLLSPRAVLLLIRHYSLDGKRSESPAKRTEEDGGDVIPAEQLWHEALSVLWRREQVAALEHLVAQVARDTLDAGGKP